jgi:hypothetical protein
MKAPFPFSRPFPTYKTSGVNSLATLISLLMLILLMTDPSSAHGQVPPKTAQPMKTPRGIMMQCIVVEGDTFFVQTLSPYILLSPKVFKSKRQQTQYTRLAVNVKRVYPYARLAGIKLKEYNDQLLEATTEKERREIMKKAEADLEAQFGNELKKLTFSQGVILLKLIDRETGQTGYDLVSELRGTFRAFFWQGLGRLFGYNLKIRYDPKGADKDIEDIVLRIMYGQM